MSKFCQNRSKILTSHYSEKTHIHVYVALLTRQELIRDAKKELKIRTKVTVNSNNTVIHNDRRYDTIRYKSLTWTRKLSIQLNLAHVARN